MFKYCPSCASEKINFNVNIFRCPDCNFSYYHNTAAATGCVISAPDADSERILFLVRGKEPSKGNLDLPGGFIDPGEGALEGLYRELKEELNWTPKVPDGESLYNVFKLFASFPNVYFFKGVNYNTCDLYFCVNAPGLELKDLRLERAEITEALFLGPDEIDLEQLAFESTKRAIRTYLELKK
jgi:ADP-ribose pyrophosphatase YjhB (NUDIX family)